MDISYRRADPHWTFVPEYKHLPLFAGIVVLAGLYVSSFVHYLLFHTLTEIFSIVIAFCIFLLAWNMRTYLANNFFRLLGFGYAFIALIDLVHALAYKEMNIFPGYDANLPTQLWIAARYMQAITLATASILIAGRKLNDYFIIGCFTVTVSALLTVVFLGIFPDCYIEGKGLTSFKIASEYIITIILLASLYFLFIKRDRFNHRVLLLIISSIICTIFSEISFTTYVSVYGFSNLLGYLFKLAAFYLIYRAIIVTGLKEPFNLIFRELDQARDKLLKSNKELEQRVEERTSELICLNRELSASEKKFRELIQKINIAVVVHGSDTRVLMSNRMAQQLLGFTEEQITGKFATDPDWHFLREDGSVLPVAEYPISIVLSIRTPLSEYVTGIRCPDRNNITWVLVNAEPEYNEAGEITQVIVSFVDITRRKHAEETLRYRTTFLEALVNSSIDGILVVDSNGKKILQNQRTIDLWKIPQHIAKNIDDAVQVNHVMRLTKNPEQFSEKITYLYNHQTETSHDVIELKDETILERYSAPVIGDDGQNYGRIWMFHDITERKQAEIALHAANEYAQNLIQTANTMVIGLDKNGSITVFNQAAEEITGYTQAELENRDWFETIVPKDLYPEVWAEFGRLSKGGMPQRFENPILTKSGEERYIAWQNNLVHEQGLLVGTISFGMDITERKQTENELRRSEEYKTIMNRIDNIFLTIPDEAMYREVLVIVLEVMESKLGIFGYIGENGDLIIPSMIKDIWDKCRIQDKSKVFPEDIWGNSLWGKTIREKRTFNSNGPFYTPGEHIPVENFLVVPIVYNQNSIGLISVANKENGYCPENINLLERIVQNISPILNARLQRDIHERMRIAAEESLKESEEKYRQLITNANEAIFIVQDEVIKFSNPKTLSMTGYSAEELTDMRFLDLINPEDRDLNIERYKKILEPAQVHEINVFKIINKNGKETWGQLITAPVSWEKKPGILCFLRDITGEKKLEAEFIQAQKMESIGRLAGGVAHDFNNMLNVIIGNADLALMDMDESSPISDNLKEIRKAAKNSSNLTQQLLAFARKQTIVPEMLHLNDIIEDMLKILRRMIGENIEIAWLPGQDIWPIKMDTSQVNQILANLCVNARDSLGDKGKITISTENTVFDKTFCRDYPEFSQGEYAVIRVSDNGCGMDQETIGKIFDPFFTTKGIGKGTGLGLATVYGIVKQNHGFIKVFSELEQGTSFNIHIPRYLTKDKKRKSNKPGKKITGGHETILLVEDETSLLKIAKSMLERLGYRVFSTSDAADAVKIAVDPASKINLLITDLIMPKMNGLQLAKKIISQNPGLKCLFMSGYIDNITDSEGILNVDKNFLQKPFSRRSLAAKVREVIDD